MKKLFTLFTLLSLITLNSFALMQTVTVQNFSFTPSSFNINLGDTVK